MKKITLLLILMITTLGFSQNNVTVSGTAAWTGYANVFDLDGNYQFGSGWGLADIKTVVTPSTNTVTLSPNFNAYTNALNGNANDIAYWTNGAGLGNKIFEGNSFVESALAGQILTFTGNVTSNTLASGYTAVAFIKGLNPATGYSADVNLSAPLVSGQPFSVTTTTAIPAGLIVQYGFTIKGLNGNSANEAALGNVVVTATAASNPTEPLTAAPTPPTRNASDVVSIYSNAYTNVTLDELPTSWSQSTFTTLQIQGDDTWKSIGEFLGIVTNYANGVDLSTMEKMHIDYWTPDNNPIGVKIVNTVDGGESLASLGTTVTGSWQSIDLDMSAFASLPNKTKITQLLIDPSGPATIYIDNFYFWKAPAASGTPTITNFTVPAKFLGDPAFTLTDPTSDSSGAFSYSSSNLGVATINGNTVTIVGLGTTTITATQAATGSFLSGSITADFVVSSPPPAVAAPTPPTRNASDVVSIYSNAYTNVTLDELPTSWSQSTFTTLQIQGDDTWKSIGEFLGIVTNYANGVDLSTMEKMHIDYWTPDNNPIGVKIVNTVDGGESLASLGTTVTGSWQSIDLDMSAFASLPNKTKITQLLIDPSGPATIYIDNFYFWKAPAASGTPTITNFTVPAKFLGDPAFTLTDPTSDSSGAFSYSSSNLGVATINGNTVTIVGLGTTTITATQAATGSFLSGSITADFVVSSPPPAVAAPTPPTRNASDVVSIYSNAYTNVTLDELPTSWSQSTFTTLQIQGDDTWKSIGEFLGIVTNYANGVDLSTMEKMHIDYWTPDNNPIGVKIVNTVDGGESLASLGTTVTGSWQSIDLDMSAFASLPNKTKITQLLIDPSGPATIYIDNFYFWKAPMSVSTFNTTKVRIYPNPTSGIVTIEANSVIESITVYNVLGQEMLSQKGNSVSETLNISNFKSGVYLVKTTSNGKTATSRIVKE